MPDAADLDLSETELEALHDCQIASEYLYRAYGDLLDFHHNLGHAMDRFHDAEERFRAAGHEGFADELRDEHLAAGAFGDQWSYEIVEDFRSDLLSGIDAFEREIRDELADGLGHVTERRQQTEWRERAGRDE